MTTPAAVSTRSQDCGLPHNLDAEKCVLGAILINSHAFPRAAEIVDANDFYRDAHRRIFEKMVRLNERGQPIDFVTVKDALDKSGELDDVGGPAYIAGLPNGMPRTANIEGYANIVRERSKRRSLVLASATLVDAVHADNAAGVAAALAALDAARDELALPDASERRIADEMARARARREANRRLDLEAARPACPPESLTLRQRLARPRCLPTFRLTGWWPTGGRILIVAQFKAGKTTLIGNTIRSLVDGELFLGRDSVRRVEGQVVLFDCEMNAGQLDSWLEHQGIRNDDQVIVIPLRGALSSFNLLDPASRRYWAKVLRDAGAEVVILDCLRPVLDSLGLDEHKDAGRLLVAFDELLREAGVTEGIVVHHAGHGQERARGDSRLRDWPDVEWQLVRESEDPSSPRYLKAYGRDVDQPESALAFDGVTRRLTIAGGTRRDAAATDALTAVLDVLKASDEPLSRRAIERACDGGDHGRDRVRDAIRLGVHNGQIHQHPGARGAQLHSLAASLRGSAR